MVNGFHRLRHHAVVRGNHNDNHIGYLRSTGTHGSKCFVSRCIQESDLTASVNFHFISTYVLGDAASFSGDHIRLTDMRSEEHTSELQSLMRISYAVFCLKKKNKTRHQQKGKMKA